MEIFRVSISPHENKKGELINACRMISEQTRQVPGCRHCSILHAPDADYPIEMKMHWQRIGRLEDYFRTDHFTALLGALKMLAIDWEMAINDGTPDQANEVVKNARRP